MSGWATNKERAALVKLLRDRDGGKICHWCGAAPRQSIDHVVSRSNSGSSALTNLVLSCVNCNARRNNNDDPQHCDFCATAHRIETHARTSDIANVHLGEVNRDRQRR